MEFLTDRSILAVGLMAGGRRLVDSFGCSTTSLSEDLHFVGAAMHFYRKSGEAPHSVHASASSNAHLIGISMSGGHHREIHHEHHTQRHTFLEQDVYIRTLDEDYKANLSGTFNFALIQIDPDVLAQLADDANMESVLELRRTISTPDPVLGGLINALTLSYQSSLIRERLALAIGIHLVDTYGVATRRRRLARGGLSRRNQNLAKELILNHLDHDLSVESLAEECNMSRSAFARAFKESTGVTPYRWITNARIELSKQLLIDRSLSLEHIAAKCGFADQSHFSRVFAVHFGEPPGSWRRRLA
ncbi:AraC family transcriptional regulator [Rhizobium miluonense]|nr:AraC family transcriptional regulator [Rhizobium miluonense]